MMRLLKRLLSVTREMIREQAKVMEESDRTERELDRSLRRTSKSKAQLALGRYDHLELRSNGGIEAGAGCRSVLERWNHRR